MPKARDSQARRSPPARAEKQKESPRLAPLLKELLVASGLPPSLTPKRRRELGTTWTVPTAAIEAAIEVERELRVGGFDVEDAEEVLRVERDITAAIALLTAVRLRAEDWLLLRRGNAARQALALYDSLPGVIRLRGGKGLDKAVLADFRKSFGFAGGRRKKAKAPPTE